MTIDQFLTYLSWSIYILLFAVALVQAIRRPLRANIDVAISFGFLAVVIAISLAGRLHIVDPASLVISGISASLLMAMVYMLLRLVADFANVPTWIMRVSEVALALIVIGNFALPLPRPVWFTLLEIIYLVALLVYTTVRFIRESHHSSGVTKRRLRAVAVGSLALFAIFVLAGLGLFVRDLSTSLQIGTQVLAITSAAGYFLGFATPSILRRAWQEPELRSFLGRAAALPRLPTTEAIVRELEVGAAPSVGAPDAAIGLWDEEKGVLNINWRGEKLERVPSLTTTLGRAFLQQKPVFTPNITPDNPMYGQAVGKYNIRAIMAAPITAGTKKLGVLGAFAPRAPIFADEDLALLSLLADQAAVILESRALIDEAARVRAREEVARLKEDFLSAAAHDLKTPLTILVAQTELLERRALRAPEAPADIASLRNLKREVHRLKTLVLELLDAARAEQGKLVGDRGPVDIVAAALEVCQRHDSLLHPCIVEADGQAIGIYDDTRIFQLLENLIENAVKYSPDGGPVRVKIWREGDTNRIAVTDVGIGIPAGDLPKIFQRFHRGENVDDRQFKGMGLGLYICRGIVEEHGGRLWAESASTADSEANNGRAAIEATSEFTDNLEPEGSLQGRTSSSKPASRGTTFHVALPAAETAPSNAQPANAEAREREQART
jgi:signal transduction histidine kinase